MKVVLNCFSFPSRSIPGDCQDADTNVLPCVQKQQDFREQREPSRASATRYTSTRTGKLRRRHCTKGVSDESSHVPHMMLTSVAERGTCCVLPNRMNRQDMLANFATENLEVFVKTTHEKSLLLSGSNGHFVQPSQFSIRTEILLFKNTLQFLEAVCTCKFQLSQCAPAPMQHQHQ
jgi:hypothetical protein